MTNKRSQTAAPPLQLSKNNATSGGGGNLEARVFLLEARSQSMGLAVRALQHEIKDIAIIKNNTVWLKWSLNIAIGVMISLGGAMVALLVKLVDK